ncbi:sortase [Oscillibacter sp.]|uniref:sortase n=1 Tax=Oscillibacter sp. TaxID=1945593 RepID=UPI00289740EE|nr:sortase [Oscillibacter sp.]
MKIRRDIVLMAAGGLLLAGSLFLMTFNCMEETLADRQATETVQVLTQQIIPELSDKTNTETTAKQIQSVSVKDESYIGVLDISTLGLSLPVMDNWSYPKLKKAPCRYSGSFLTDDMIIAGHNYKRHFGLLKQLKQGDLITFTDVDGFVYSYQVVTVETLASSDMQDMRFENPGLTLFTCTYGGNSRVAVRCERESS